MCNCYLVVEPIDEGGVQDAAEALLGRYLTRTELEAVKKKMEKGVDNLILECLASIKNKEC